MIRVFMSGQSNGIGRGQGGPDFAVADSRVTVWNNVNPGGGDVQSGPYGTAFIAPERGQAPFDPNGGNNLGLWFSHRVAQVLNDTVQFLLCGEGGTSIVAWVDENGNAANVLNSCLSAWSASGQQPAHVFLWHQGEGDTGQSQVTYAEYMTRFNQMLGILQSSGVIDSNTIVIVGGLAEENQNRIDFNNQVLKELASGNEKIYYAPSTGLLTYDGTHFQGQSLYTFGAERYFEQYLISQGLEMADIFALVNKDGTPGEAGTGTNGLYNLKKYSEIGLDKKDVTLSSAFTGTLPADHIMTAGMLAAGSPVEFGIDPTNGTFFRFESGLQVCWLAVPVAYATVSSMSGTWTFPRPFVTPPFIVPAFNRDMYNAQLSLAYLTSPYVTSTTETQCVATQGRQSSTAGATSFQSGDVGGVNCLALGFWK